MKTYIGMICVSLLLISCRDREFHEFEFPNEEGGRFQNETGARQNTASYGYQQADAYAKTLDRSLKLILVSGDNVSPHGTSYNWKYQFVSTDKMIIYYFEQRGNEVNFDSTGAMSVGNSIITSPWINSDFALSTAEGNGGREFRNENPGCEISAALSEPVIPNAYPMWNLTYDSPTGTLYIVIDASSGKFVSGRINAPSTAVSVSNVIGNLQYTFTIPKSVFGIHDTLRASMTAMNTGTVPETLYVNYGNIRWMLNNAEGDTIMSGPRVISNYLIREVILSNQSALVGLISAPIMDKSGNPVQAGSYQLRSGSLTLNLMIK
jgi:hypothetical protein